MLEVRKAAAKADGTLSREKGSEAFRLCQRGEVDRALAILEGFDGSDGGEPADSALDPERDLKVSFRGELEPGQHVEHIAGKVENTSPNAYGCVRLEFQLATPSSATKEKGLRPLRTVETEVRGIPPGATVSFGLQLDCPVSFWHKGVSLCEDGPSVQNGFAVSPRILSFWVEPEEIDRGKFVSLFWQVENAEYVLLYDDHGFLDSGSESGWPSSMRGYNKEQLNQDTTFVLWAVGKNGCVSKRFAANVRGKEIN